MLPHSGAGHFRGFCSNLWLSTEQIRKTLCLAFHADFEFQNDQIWGYDNPWAVCCVFLKIIHGENNNISGSTEQTDVLVKIYTEGAGGGLHWNHFVCLSICSSGCASNCACSIFPEKLNHFFLTRRGMVVYYHKVMCHTEKLVHYLQCESHSAGLYNQNMTIFLWHRLICWSIWNQTWSIVQHHKPNCPVEKWDCCIQGKGHSEGSKC